MARAIDPRQTFEFILPADRELPEDAPDRTVWNLRALTPGEDAAIADAMAFASGDGDAQEFGLRSGTTSLKALRLGLQGWDKLLDAEGNPVEFKGRRVGSTNGARVEATDEDIARIHPKDRVHIVNAITSAGRITGDEAGK